MKIEFDQPQLDYKKFREKLLKECDELENEGHVVKGITLNYETARLLINYEHDWEFVEKKHLRPYVMYGIDLNRIKLFPTNVIKEEYIYYWVISD